MFDTANHCPVPTLPVASHSSLNKKSLAAFHGSPSSWSAATSSLSPQQSPSCQALHRLLSLAGALSSTSASIPFHQTDTCSFFILSLNSYFLGTYSLPPQAPGKPGYSAEQGPRLPCYNTCQRSHCYAMLISGRWRQPCTHTVPALGTSPVSRLIIKVMASLIHSFFFVVRSSSLGSGPLGFWSGRELPLCPQLFCHADHFPHGFHSSKVQN